MTKHLSILLYNEKKLSQKHSHRDINGLSRQNDTFLYNKFTIVKAFLLHRLEKHHHPRKAWQGMIYPKGFLPLFVRIVVP